MIKMDLNNRVYEIPDSLTVDQWRALIRWDITDESNWARLINIVTEAPIEELKEADRDGLELGIIFIATLMNKREEVAVKDFNHLKFGEWVDLDIYLTTGIEKRLWEILKVLEVEVENAHQALWVIDEYTKWRTYIYNQYTKLFDLDIYSELAEEMPHDPNAHTKVAKSWYKIIVDLAGDNPLNIGPVTELGVKEALNFMALRKERALEEAEKQRKQKREYDLQRNR